MDLPQLQTLLRRDPQSYHDEFSQALRHFHATARIFDTSAASATDSGPTNNAAASAQSASSVELGELAMFLGHSAHLYASTDPAAAAVPRQIHQLLAQHAQIIDAELRRTLVRCLALLYRQDMIPAAEVLQLYFKLFACQDKLLRETLYRQIIGDIRAMNVKSKKTKVNRALQNFMYTMLSDANAVAAKKSLDVMIELYRLHIWDDSNTVNVIASACFSLETKITVAALKFFVGHDADGGNESEEEDDSDMDDPNLPQSKKDVTWSAKVTKKTRKRQRRMERALDQLKKRQAAKKKKPQHHFSALAHINDPQGFAEKVFKRLKSSTERFEVRLIMMNVISRVIGVHQLFVLNFYPFLQRYLQPHQKDVTLIIAYLAQATHELLPPDVLEPVIMTLVNNFVNDKSAPEVVTVGLNAVREVCARCPLAMTDSLMGDLALYRTDRNKGIGMAARSLIRHFRVVNPSVLPRKYRMAGTDGMDDDFDYAGKVIARDYGANAPSEFASGAELLAAAQIAKERTVALKAEEERVRKEEESKEKAQKKRKRTDDDDDDGDDGEESGDEWESASESGSDDDDEEGEEEGEEEEEEEEEEAAGAQSDDDDDEGWEDASDSGEESEGWIDVRHSSDDEEKETEEERKKKSGEAVVLASEVDPLEAKRKAAEMSQTRLLTPADYKLIERLRKERLESARRGRKRKHGDAITVETTETPEAKRKREQRENDSDGNDDSDDEEILQGTRVKVSAIEAHVKRKRAHDYETRMESVKEGREGREKRGGKKGKHNVNSSKTNAQKTKMKNAMMVIHGKKVSHKRKRSLHDKTKATREAIVKRAKQYK